MNLFPLHARLGGLVLGAALSAGAAAAIAQPAAPAYPVKPITVIVPFTAGGSTDIAARIVCQQLAQVLGQAVVVENKPGAGATLGAAQVARAAPDGYTLLWGGNSPLTTSPYLYKKPGYDPVASFTPIAISAVSPWVLMTAPSMTAANVAELVAQARSRPGQLTFATSGINSALHLITEQFKASTGIDAVHVPYKGDADVAQAVASGQVDFAFAALSTSLPFIQSGKARPIAVTGPRRDRQLPQVPTVAEAGVPDMTMEFFSGLLAPAGTPPAVTSRLVAAVKQAMQDAGARERLQKAGAEPVAGTPDEFKAAIARDGARWQAMIKKLGASLE